MSDLSTPLSRDQIPEGVKVVNVAKDDFGLEIATELVPLPSEGKVYSTPSLKGKEFVEIMPMTARHEDILMSKALIKKGTVINELIKHSLVDKSIKVEELVEGDKLAIMIALRITGYGAGYEISAECDHCNTISKNEFNLSELPIKRLSAEPVEMFTNRFSFVLPVSKANVIVKLQDGYDEIEQFRIENMKKKASLTGQTSVTDALMFSIVEVNNIKDRNKLKQFISNMPAKDSLALRKFIGAISPTVEMKQTYECSSCGEESEVGIPLSTQFFWPDSWISKVSAWNNSLYDNKTRIYIQRCLYTSSVEKRIFC